MRTALFAFSLLLALSACAAVDQGSSEAEGTARELAGLEAGQAVSCIDQSPSANLVIVDRRTLAYRQSGTVWINRLEAECPGFRPFNTLLIDSYGGRYCRGDQVRAVEAGSSIAGPICRLNDFIPYRRR
jgi:hypothetical protein